VAVGISGGVDSSVTAALLKEQGYKVIGVHMTNWDDLDEMGLLFSFLLFRHLFVSSSLRLFVSLSLLFFFFFFLLSASLFLSYLCSSFANSLPSSPLSGHCSGAADSKAAENVCKQLSIPLHHVNFVKEYWLDVFEPMLSKYSQGLTPNPDTLCNKMIKFSLFTRYALETLKTDFVATGHYSRIVEPGNKLRIAADYSKDQSYFLCMIPRDSLRRVLFPIGDLTKKQVRVLARERNLVSAEREESMGICFVGKRDLGSFLDEYIPNVPGTFVDIDSGKVMGNHTGFSHYTMGQGACLGGQKTKWYVCGKNTLTKTIYIGNRHMHPGTLSDFVDLAELSWLGEQTMELLEREEGGTKCLAMQKNAGPLFGCTLRKTTHDESSGDGTTTTTTTTTTTKFRLIFDEPQRALSPGQTIALYNDQHDCLGGALIHKRGHAAGPLFQFEAEPGYI